MIRLTHFQNIVSVKFKQWYTEILQIHVIELKSLRGIFFECIENNNTE